MDEENTLVWYTGIRAYHRILKLSCTIVDLTGSVEIQSVYLAEALQYRPKFPLML